MEKDGADTASGEITHVQQARHAVSRTFIYCRTFGFVQLYFPSLSARICAANAPSWTTASGEFPLGDLTSIHSLP